MVIQNYFQRLGVSGVVEREQLLVKLLHVLFLHRQHPRARPQKDLAGQRETCALVAVPEKPAPCSPCTRIECFFGCARVGVQNSGERRAALYFVRNRRQIIRAGYTDLSRAQFAPHKRLIPCDVFVQLAEVFQRQRHIHGIEQKTPGIAHIEDSLNIVELRARNVHAVQNRARLRESHCPVFHLHAAIDILIPLFLQETGFALRSYEIYPYTFYVHRPMSPDKKKIPPSRVHSKRKPCIARRYPRLCFALPTSAAVEPRGRPAYLQSNIGFHFIVVGSDMVVYHELSRKVCFQYMRVRAIYALSFRYCRRPHPRRNRRC